MKIKKLLAVLTLASFASLTAAVAGGSFSPGVANTDNTDVQKRSDGSLIITGTPPATPAARHDGDRDREEGKHHGSKPKPVTPPPAPVTDGNAGNSGT